MGGDILICFALLLNGFSIILQSYLLLALWDLQSDYINSITCTNRLNAWLKPSTGIASIQILFLWASQHFGPTLIPLAVVVWVWYRKSQVTSGETEVYDPTTIRQRSALQKALVERVALVGAHVANFFIIMFILTSKLDP